MSDFSARMKAVKAVRKTHCCEQCNKIIDVGSPAKYSFGIWEGYPYSTYTHVECNEAAHEYATLNDLWFEEYPWFQYMDDSECGHHAWLLEKHPIVAKRLGAEPKEIESGANAAADSPALDTASNTTTRIIAANGGENHD